MMHFFLGATAIVLFITGALMALPPAWALAYWEHIGELSPQREAIALRARNRGIGVLVASMLCGLASLLFKVSQ